MSPPATAYSRNEYTVAMACRAASATMMSRRLSKNGSAGTTTPAIPNFVADVKASSTSRSVLALSTWTEIPKALAVLAASGVPQGVLARSLLWQVALPGDGDVSGGCGCQAGDSAGSTASLLLLALGAMILRVRRRRVRKD